MNPVTEYSLHLFKLTIFKIITTFNFFLIQLCIHELVVILLHNIHSMFYIVDVKKFGSPFNFHRRSANKSKLHSLATILHDRNLMFDTINQVLTLFSNYC